MPGLNLPLGNTCGLSYCCRSLRVYFCDLWFPSSAKATRKQPVGIAAVGATSMGGVWSVNEGPADSVPEQIFVSATPAN